MKLFRYYVLIFLIGHSPAINAQVTSEPPTPFEIAEQDAKRCENWTKADWDNYLKNDLLPGLNQNLIPVRLEKVIEVCRKSFEQNNIGLCTNRILNYFSHFSPYGPAGMFSAIKSDESYLASIPKTAAEFPAELKTLKGALPTNWRDIVAQKGWSYVLFHSDTGNTARLVVRVPGKEYDKLIMYFSVDSKNSDPTKSDGIQMQSVEKTKDAKATAKYFFNSYNFLGPGRTAQAFPSGGRCVLCHSGGPRAVVPVKNPNFKTELGGVKSLEEFNNAIVQPVPPDLSPYYDMKNMPSQLKVGKDCQSCHNGKDRTSLAMSVNARGYFNPSEFHRKVVSEETMPQGADPATSPENRLNMVTEIRSDYKIQMQKWLTEVTCQGGEPKAHHDGNQNKGSSTNK